MSTRRDTTAKPSTPRVQAGQKLFKSAQGDLRSAQRKLDAAKAIRQAARRAAA